MGIIEHTIREHIIKLLANELTFEQFKQWFFSTTHDTEDDMAYDIRLLFAEYSHGDWTEAEMRHHLRDTLEHATIGEKPSITIETGTSSTTETPDTAKDTKMPIYRAVMHGSLAAGWMLTLNDAIRSHYSHPDTHSIIVSLKSAREALDSLERELQKQGILEDKQA
jgi:hypothetical protein